MRLDISHMKYMDLVKAINLSDELYCALVEGCDVHFEVIGGVVYLCVDDDGGDADEKRRSYIRP